MPSIAGLFTRLDPAGPALQPPPGVIPDLEDPPNVNNLTFLAIIVCTIACLASLVIRTSFLAMTRLKPKVEDYFALTALGLFFAYVASLFWVINVHGFMVHQWNYRLMDMIEFARHVNIISVLYEATMMPIKIAILLAWTNIFVPTHGRDSFFWVCWLLIVLITMYYIAAILVMTLSCVPRARIWDKTVPGTCIDSNILYSTSGSINLVTDLVIFFLPQRKIWNLKLSTKKKCIVAFAFSIGLLGCAAAAARINANVNAFMSQDQTYTLGQVALWCMAEMTCGFIIYAAPAAPLVFGSKGWVAKTASKVGTIASQKRDSMSLARRASIWAGSASSTWRTTITRSADKSANLSSSSRNNGNKYQEMVSTNSDTSDSPQTPDFGTLHSKSSNGSSLRLGRVEAPVIRPLDAVKRIQRHYQPPEHGILCTTHIETQSEASSTVHGSRGGSR